MRVPAGFDPKGSFDHLVGVNVSSFDVTEVGEPAAEGVKDRGRRPDIDAGCRHQEPDPGDRNRRLCLPSHRRQGDRSDSSGENGAAAPHRLTSLARTSRLVKAILGSERQYRPPSDHALGRQCTDALSKPPSVGRESPFELDIGLELPR